MNLAILSPLGFVKNIFISDLHRNSQMNNELKLSLTRQQFEKAELKEEIGRLEAEIVVMAESSRSHGVVSRAIDLLINEMFQKTEKYLSL